MCAQLSSALLKCCWMLLTTAMVPNYPIIVTWAFSPHNNCQTGQTFCPNRSEQIGRPARKISCLLSKNNVGDIYKDGEDQAGDTDKHEGNREGGEAESDASSPLPADEDGRGSAFGGDSSFYRDLRKAKVDKFGFRIPPDQLKESAQNAESEFLQAMEETSKEFQKAKDDLGSKGAVDLFLEKIRQEDERESLDDPPTVVNNNNSGDYEDDSKTNINDNYFNDEEAFQ